MAQLPNLAGIAPWDAYYQNTMKTMQVQPKPVAAPKPAGVSMFGNPFSTAMSGTQKGTLQPWINSQVQQANGALNGGLLGFNSPMLMAGNAGGQTSSMMPMGGSVSAPMGGMQQMPHRGYVGKGGGVPASANGSDFSTLKFTPRSWM